MIAALLILAAGLDPLVARVVEAYGGKARLARVQAVRETGTSESPRGKAQLTRSFSRKGQLRVELAREEGPSETRILSGELAFYGTEKADGPAHDAMVLQHARLLLPAMLQERRALLVDLGELTRAGQKTHGIGIPLSRGLSLAIDVDSKGHIVRSEGALQGGTRFVTEYSDFRNIDGVLVALGEEGSVSGHSTGKIRLSRVEFVADLPASDFRPRGVPF